MPFTDRLGPVALSLAALAAGTVSAATYTNPVLAGDHPDPSVIRVGSEYWATATTSQWAPIFPLLHSTDLVNWRHVGNVFERAPEWSAGSYWAPEIAEHRGRFFVYYTARKRGGPLCVAVADAPRPAGPYTDHGPLICQDAGAIDGVPVTDESGVRYLVWKEDGNSRKLPTPLWAQRLSDTGVSLVGEKQEILRNEAPWEAHLIEGPFILRRPDAFYMFYSADACCGPRCNYKLGVARAPRLLGPWERYGGNPILAGNDTWKCPGHGSVVSDDKGRTFMLYHAYESRGFQYVGRQGVLDEITWGKDGWPAINAGGGTSHTVATIPAQQTVRPAALVDDFTAPVRDPRWQWPWDQPTLPHIDPSQGGWLSLSISPAVPAPAAVAVAARPTLSGSYTATTIVDVGAIGRGTRAGLAAFGSRENFLAVTIEQPTPPAAGSPPAGNAPLVNVWRMQKGETRILASEPVSKRETLHLRLTARDRTRFEFAVSPDGRAWRVLPIEGEGSDLPPWDLSVRVALLLSGQANSSARFGEFRLSSQPE